MDRQPGFILFSSIVEKNGKTVRENNMEVGHNIPIDTLVEVKYDTWHGNGACSKVHARLFVVGHDRDCDGSPLYCLAPSPGVFEDIDPPGLVAGFGEESLTPVELDDRLREGHGALEWDD